MFWIVLRSFYKHIQNLKTKEWMYKGNSRNVSTFPLLQDVYTEGSHTDCQHILFIAAMLVTTQNTQCLCLASPHPPDTQKRGKKLYLIQDINQWLNDFKEERVRFHSSRVDLKRLQRQGISKLFLTDRVLSRKCKSLAQYHSAKYTSLFLAWITCIS